MENKNLVFVACDIDPRYKMKYVSIFIRESYCSSGDNIAFHVVDCWNQIL